MSALQLSEAALRRMLVELCREAGSQQALANRLRVPRTDVAHAVAGDRPFPRRVAGALGFCRRVVYERNEV